MVSIGMLKFLSKHVKNFMSTKNSAQCYQTDFSSDPIFPAGHETTGNEGRMHPYINSTMCAKCYNSTGKVTMFLTKVNYY